MAEASLCHRTAESALYGYGIVSALVDVASDVLEAIAGFHASASELLILRIPACAVDGIHAAERAGALCCDVLVSHALPASRWGAVASRDPNVLPATHAAEVDVGLSVPSDLKALEMIAGEAFANGTTHWHTDPRTGGTRVAELYRRWTADLARAAGPARPLLVARHADRPVGFAATEPTAGDTWRVALAAVAPDAQGQGILTRLLRTAIGYLPTSEGGLFVYETQLTNLPASRAVATLGFRPKDAHLTFHLWRTTA